MASPRTRLVGRQRGAGRRANPRARAVDRRARPLGSAAGFPSGSRVAGRCARGRRVKHNRGAHAQPVHKVGGNRPRGVCAARGTVVGRAQTRKIQCDHRLGPSDSDHRSGRNNRLADCHTRDQARWNGPRCADRSGLSWLGGLVVVAVAFEGELALAGPDGGFDPLTDGAEGAP